MAISVNEEALKIVKELMANEKFYNIKSKKLGNGSTVIDMGIDVLGGYNAGLKLGEICLGGFATVTMSSSQYDGTFLPTVVVTTEYPHISCLGSQFAGWRCNVKDAGYFAMVSGPARALKGGEQGLFDELDYIDTAKVSVAVLEANTLPNETVMDFIASKCKVSVENTYALVAPTRSICGSVQIAARIVETGIHKLHEVKFDPKKIIFGTGTVPIGPIAKSDTKAMGITNDAIIAAGSVFLTVKSLESDNISEIIQKVPSSTSHQYGKPFFEIFKEAGNDFYKIDPHLFAPAQMIINDIRTGETFTAGKIDVSLLKTSFNI
ncbi:MAG: methenyltetrahydromethanopterin cyclohydrolase [Candidatus Lokiarchaeota archaeon]|nr:methenyltetrahydromethanopterin cyclohydrolase [Candidatus Lokiarchaeota archaeon]